MSGALLRMETGRGIPAFNTTPIENIVLGVIFMILVAATCTMGALMVLARRRQGKCVATTPQMLPVLTIANTIMAVVGAYRWWGFALGSLVNMTATVLLFLSNKRFGALAGDKKSTDEGPNYGLPRQSSSGDLKSVWVESPKTPRAPQRDRSQSPSGGAVRRGSEQGTNRGRPQLREHQQKSVVDMLRDHQLRFGSNACNIMKPAPFSNSDVSHGALEVSQTLPSADDGAGIRTSPFAPLACSPPPRSSIDEQPRGFCHLEGRRSRSLDSLPVVHSVTEDIVDSLLGGAVMEQLLTNGKKSRWA